MFCCRSRSLSSSTVLFGQLWESSFDIIRTPLISRSNDRILVGPVALAYTFGLRHALDADHIAAIDNVRPHDVPADWRYVGN